jgi:predicted DNA repair protein MutK
LAGSSLLALIDDIATLLDDVSLLTKVAAKKTAGVLGDDLALNAQQVAGVSADRELPVVWAVAKGSLLNKGILVPVALLLSAVSTWLVRLLLMVGGAYLCFEGFEKVFHHFFRADEDASEAERRKALLNPAVDLLAFEREQVKGAIRTDFVLSAEIIVITLGSVANEDFVTRLTVLAGIGVIMTVGVYGLVAGIVKLDDAGLYLSRRLGKSAVMRVTRAFGRLLLRGAPYLMRALSVGGTIAMFLVGGSIVTEGIPPLHHAIEAATAAVSNVPLVAPLLGGLLHCLVGLAVGALVLVAVTLFRRIWGSRAAQLTQESGSKDETDPAD